MKSIGDIGTLRGICPILGPSNGNFQCFARAIFSSWKKSQRCFGALNSRQDEVSRVSAQLARKP